MMTLTRTSAEVLAFFSKLIKLQISNFENYFALFMISTSDTLLTTESKKRLLSNKFHQESRPYLIYQITKNYCNNNGLERLHKKILIIKNPV